MPATEPAPRRLSPTRFALLLFAGAFLVRLALAALLRDLERGPEGPPTADEVEFNRLAIGVAEGRGYVGEKGQPTSFRAPGFPLLLAGLYGTGVNYPLAYLFFCALGAASCVLTYLLARELLAEGWARIAGALSAVYLPHAYFSATFLSENSFVPLLALGSWLFIRHLKGGPAWLAGAAGLALGGAALTRPFALLLLPLLLLPLRAAARRQGRGWLVPATAYAVAFIAVIVPWTLRNQAVHGRFVLVATNGGSTFYGGNNDRVVTVRRDYGHWISTTELPHRDQINAAPDEVSHDKVEWRLGFEWLRDNAAKIPLLAAFKLMRLWLWPPDFDVEGYRVLRMAVYVPFLLLFALGMWRCVRRAEYRTAPWWVLHLNIVATLITALVFWGSPRFRDVNVPFLMIYATLGLEAVTRRGGRPASAEAPPGTTPPAHSPGPGAPA